MILAMIPAVAYYILSNETTKPLVVLVISLIAAVNGCMIFFGIPSDYVHKDDKK